MHTLRRCAVVGLLSLLCAVRVHATCSGDCSGDGEVTVNELVLGVNIALDNTALSQCGSFDNNGDGMVTVNEIIGAVTSALGGCTTSDATPTPTATAKPSEATPTQGTRPTPAAGCGGGFAEATFSDAVGTNARQPLTGTVPLTKLTGVIGAAAFPLSPTGMAFSLGSAANKCPTGDLGLAIEVSISSPDAIVPGNAYPLNQKAGQFFPPNSLTYAEVFAVPVGRLNWTASSGMLVVDSIAGDTLSFHVVDAQMVAGTPFPIGPAPTGTFTLNLDVTVDMVRRQ